MLRRILDLRMVELRFIQIYKFCWMGELLSRSS
jgi:hypothetical protein